MAVAIFGHLMHVKLVAEFPILQSISKDNLVHQIKAICRNIYIAIHRKVLECTLSEMVV